MLFTPHLMPASRGILATCYAKAARPGDPLAILRDAYAGEPFIHVGETPPETKWATGSNAAFLTARYDERTGTVVALAAIDNLGKGAAGQMIQCANLMLGLDEGAGLIDHGSLSVSVTLAEGFVASGLAAGIKTGGRRDVSLLATDDGKPVPAAAVFTQNKFRAPPVEASLERLNVSGGYASGVIVNSGNANAGTGAKGRADAEAMCAAAAEAVGCDPRDMLVCSTGLIGFRLPMRKILTAIPRLGETLSRERPSRRGQGHPHHRHAAQGGAGRPRRIIRSAAWPRAAACSRPTWRPCSPSSPPTPSCRRRS